MRTIVSSTNTREQTGSILKIEKSRYVMIVQKTGFSSIIDRLPSRSFKIKILTAGFHHIYANCSRQNQ